MHNLDANTYDDLSSLDLGIYEARDLVQNRPLWRLMSLHSALVVLHATVGLFFPVFYVKQFRCAHICAGLTDDGWSQFCIFKKKFLYITWSRLRVVLSFSCLCILCRCEYADKTCEWVIKHCC